MTPIPSPPPPPPQPLFHHLPPPPNQLRLRPPPLRPSSSKAGSGDVIKYVPLYRALVKCDLESVKDFLEKDPDAIYANISTKGEKPIHIAVLHGHQELVEELLKRIRSGWRLRSLIDDNGDTPLHIAARGRNTIMAKALCRLQFADVKNEENDIPLTLAAIHRNKDLLEFLRPMYSSYYERNRRDGRLGSPYNPSPASKWQIFTEFVKSKNFGLARQILDSVEPELMRFKDVLYIMAEMTTVFLSANQLTTFQRWIYDCKCMDALYSSHKKDMDAIDAIDAIDAMDVSTTPAYRPKRCIEKVRHFLKGLMLRVLKAIGTERILDMRVKKSQAHELLCMMCSPIWTFDSKHVGVYFEAIKRAIKCGNVEFVEEVLRSNPALLWGNRENGTIFHIAVAFRQEKIWNLIYGLSTEHKNKITGIPVKSNSLLHLAACPMVMFETITIQYEAPKEVKGEQQSQKVFSKARDAAMKMQRELQWYKEVERMVPSSYVLLANNDGETPSDLFSNYHYNLVKEGEQWMRHTAGSFTIVATLIVTVMFAAAFTLPGGTDDNSGNPKFLQHNSFMVFIISDAISLFSSVTAVLMFLSILTSRCTKDDFLNSLPKRLIIGLASLFLSIATMMVTFVATLVIVLGERRKMVVAPIALLASIPVTSFVKLQFPLFVDIFSSTYGRGIFNRKTKCHFFNNPNDYVPPNCSGFSRVINTQ